MNLIFTFFLAFFLFESAQAITCATSENIQGLSQEDAINLAYQSGLRGGNFGMETHDGSGMLFIDKKHAEASESNLDILNLYATLNGDLLLNKEGKDWPKDHPHQYSGLYHPTYSQSQECRRQVLITDVKEENGKKYFTGWVNVELCHPAVKQAFAGAKAYFQKNNQLLDSIDKLFPVVEQQNPALGKQLREALETTDPGVYYAKTSDGHIAPRFSVKLKITFDYINYETKKYDPESCNMIAIPSSAYSGVLAEEIHYFSDSIHESMVYDPDFPFWPIPVFDSQGESVYYNFPTNEKVTE